MTQLSLQGNVSKREIRIDKVGAEDGIADALLTGVDAMSTKKHCRGLGIGFRPDRHALAPTLEKDKNNVEETFVDA